MTVSEEIMEKDNNAPQHPKSKQSAVPNGNLSTATLEKLLHQLQDMNLPFKSMIASTNPSLSQDPKKPHKFWETQPVPQSPPGNVTESGHSIEPDRTEAELEGSHLPLRLPSPFYWCELDLLKDEEMAELYKLLSENYVEDEDYMFRFNYPPSFLQWALLAKGWRKEWHVGVRVEGSNRLVAFIGAIPTTTRIHDQEKPLVQINFLCILKKLRNKRLSPVLIREITRRVHKYGHIFQALYTAGIQLPTPVSVCQYFHRPLNVKKLIDTGFSALPEGMTVARMSREFELKPESNFGSRLRPMIKEDIPAVFTLLNSYLNRYDLRPVFLSEEELAHWILPRENVVHAYVLEGAEDKNALEAFVSFYELPSTVLRPSAASTYQSIRTGYLYYYAVEDRTLVKPLMEDILALASSMEFDVFNCLDVMDNHLFLASLRFGLGDGRLHYYLFNWVCPSISPHKIAFLML